MTMLSMLLSKLRSFLLFFVNIFRRALCCFRRRRRNSGEAEQLMNIVVKETSVAATNDLEQWNDWEFTNRKPSNVQEHIEYYRQRQAKLSRLSDSVDEQNDENDDVDAKLFEDLEPKIQKQKKVLVGNEDVVGKSYTLDMQADDGEFLSNELENWEETSGWERDNVDWVAAQEMLRKKKQQEREQRAWMQQQKRLEKSAKPNALGARIAAT